MTSRECEKKLLDLMEEARRIFKEYAPDGSHLDLFSTDDGLRAMGYSGEAGKRLLIVDGFKSAEGGYRFSDRK